MKLIVFFLVAGLAASSAIAGPEAQPSGVGQATMPPSPMDPTAAAVPSRAVARKFKKTKKPDVSPSPMNPAARVSMPPSPMEPAARVSMPPSPMDPSAK